MAHCLANQLSTPSNNQTILFVLSAKISPGEP
jgi:hypothetical protein